MKRKRKIIHPRRRPESRVGEEYGFWKIISIKRIKGISNAIARCVCRCGTKREVLLHTLVHGGSKSCGCWNLMAITARNTTHGRTNTPEYISWASMKSRCLDDRPKMASMYKNRGIAVCRRWRRFENFLSDMGPRPVGTTLDRIDNDKGYRPGNCRWATKKEQAENTRRNLWIEHGGVRDTQSNWARLLGITASQIQHHRDRGRSFAEIFSRFSQRYYANHPEIANR